MSKESAILGRIPIITNSVRPMPKPPIASDSRAFLLVGCVVFFKRVLLRGKGNG